ncbi:aldehyde:ferredoxin oxidoreductase [Candidatus Bathyarchaeota archaeon]|nr:aldehyde:ferredoxin oxidoreductase [Candidatus Bathyarchaeota archaeon]
MSLAEIQFPSKKMERGYNNRTLYVNLSEMKIKTKPVSRKMKQIFTGGRGFNLWLMWNSLPKNQKIKWTDPANEICISSGPLSGIPGFPGGGKSIAMSISPLTNMIIDSNVGGFFGPYLKFSGWDALEIQGKSTAEVYIFIDGDNQRITIEDAQYLPSETNLIVDILSKKHSPKNPLYISIVSTGPGAENTLMGCLNVSWYDSIRGTHRFKQAGRGGIGTVLRDKKIKAIVVKYSEKMTLEKINPADSTLVKKIILKYNKELRKLDPKQNEMSIVGTAHLVPIMNNFDLLPVNNFKYGSHKDAEKLGREVYRKKFHSGYAGCWVGCALSCSHVVKDFELSTGPDKGQKVFVNGPEYETIAGVGSNCGIFDAEYVIEMNYYCDIYGLDTISVGTSIAFAMECYELGLIDNKFTEGLNLCFGDKEAVLNIIHQMAQGTGFGVIIGKGIRQMKKLFEKNGVNPDILKDIGMESKGLEFSEYVTKESLAQQGGYGLTLKGAQHDEAWLIFLDMVHNLMPTFEQKAENLHWFPMWRTWFSLNGLCKLPWNDVVPEGNNTTKDPAKVMSHVDNYIKFFFAITGNKVKEKDIILMSERVYNFQRIFNVRMVLGTRKQDTVPYRAVGPVTKEEYASRIDRYDKQIKDKLDVNPKHKSIEIKIALLRKFREKEYELLKDAVYKRRGWNNNGVPTIAKIKSVGIDFPDVLTLLSQ